MAGAVAVTGATTGAGDVFAAGACGSTEAVVAGAAGVLEAAVGPVTGGDGEADGAEGPIDAVALGLLWLVAWLVLPWLALAWLAPPWPGVACGAAGLAPAGDADDAGLCRAMAPVTESSPCSRTATRE
jgi:hypothetical protein